MNKTNVTTVVTVVEDEKTLESAKADKKKWKCVDDAMEVLHAAFAPKKPATEGHESGGK